MTALLAFFIVLNSLAEEQTGANLHAGTGSFIDALESFGLPGTFKSDSSSRSFQLSEPSPLYIVPDPEGRDTDPNPTGPDDDGDQTRVIDREAEDYQRFLNELGRMSTIEPVASVTGDVAFDCFENLRNDEEPLPRSLWEAAVNLRHIYSQEGYEIELTVWATTPSESAWTRASEQADELRDTLVTRLHLTAEAREKFQAVSRPWIYSNLERPTVSLSVRRISDQ